MKICFGSIAALILASAQLVGSHYTFGNFYANNALTGEWEYVRMTANHVDNGPLTDVTSQGLRCWENDNSVASDTGIIKVNAGSTVGFKASNNMGHPGYFSAYMTPASPSADSSQAGTGKTWFKIWEWSPRYTPETGLIFDSTNIWQFNFTIPKNIPNGDYLIRGEQIALHVAGQQGGAQFYLGCAQVTVTGGGSGTPSPTVSIPGVYKATDPGILINIYALPSGFTRYPAPGPAVWSG